MWVDIPLDLHCPLLHGEDGLARKGMNIAHAAPPSILARAVRQPEVFKGMLGQGIVATAGPAGDFGREVAKEVADWAEVARADTA